MKHSKTLWITAVVLLVGCNSFNRYELREDPGRNSSFQTAMFEKAMRVQEKLPVSVTVNDAVSCPPFQLPELPKKPELPYHQLAAIKKGDSDAVDQLYQKHILELRKHINLVESTVRKSYSQYLETCGKYVSTQATGK